MLVNICYDFRKTNHRFFHSVRRDLPDSALLLVRQQGSAQQEQSELWQHQPGRQPGHCETKRQQCDSFQRD